MLALGGVALAGDGGGAIAYLRQDAGVPHVFVAILTAGTWSTPVRVDGALAAAAAQPVVAAAAGGRVAVAFTSGGALYATVRAGPGTGFTPPQQIAPAAADPALSMGASGTAYVAYAVPTGDLLAARLDRTATMFAGLPTPLDAAAGGAGAGPSRRASIAVSADATGIVAWGQDGPDGRTHVLARRVYGLHVGSVLLDATLDQLGGVAGGSADAPAVGVQDDSSYAWIAFRQTFGPTARALARPLVGSALGDPQSLDALGTPPTDAAGPPSLAIDGVGDGLAATQLAGGGNVIGAAIGAAGFAGAQQVNQVAAVTSPAPVAAVSRTGHGAIAFADTQGGLDVRLYAQGAVGAQAALSRPDYGPVYAPGGLAAAADARGDIVVAYLQGTPGTLRVAAAAIVDPPGYLAGLTSDHFIRSAQPTLQWTASRGGFSPITYTVLLDGTPVGTTAATSLRLPAPVADGVHHWQVIARDSLGQQTPAAVRALRIAARPPRVTLTVAGSRRAHARLAFDVGVTAAAGVGSVAVAYGDGARGSGAHTRHAYAGAGRYTVVIVVFDRAGNRAVLRRRIAVG